MQAQAAAPAETKADASAREMIRYARHLGIDPVYDSDLLWIAEQAYDAPVPENWQEHLDEEHNIYYFNQLTGASSWTHPLEVTWPKARCTRGCKTRPLCLA